MNAVQAYVNHYQKNLTRTNSAVCPVNGDEHDYLTEKLKDAAPLQFFVVNECQCGASVINRVISKI